MKRLLILAVCLITGMAGGFAQEGKTRSVTYTVNSDGTVSMSGVEPAGSVAEFTNTYGQKTQMTSGNTAILKLKNYDGCIVTSLTLNMHSNQSDGAGTFSFKSGNNVIAAITKGTTFNKWYNINKYINEYTDVCVKFNSEYTDGFVVAEGQELTVTIAATVNSLYIQSYTITYQLPEEILDAPMITPTKGEVFNRKQQIIISCDGDVDHIHYTVDGTEPTMESAIYDEETPVYIDETTTIKAFAVKEKKQSKVRVRSFKKADNMKAIVAYYAGQYYAMTKQKTPSTNAGHLAGKVISVCNNMAFSTPGSIENLAWQMNTDGSIQSYGSKYYLNNNNAVTKLGDDAKVLWEENEEYGLNLVGSTRYLRYVISGKYFASYEKSWISDANLPAYPVDLVKGYVRTGLQLGSWGTICLPYDVLSDDRSGAVFYNIAGKKAEADGTVLVLEEETGVLAAGQPYVFVTTADALCCMYLDIAEENIAAEKAGKKNGLIGSFSQTEVAEGMYVVKNGRVVKCDTGWGIQANRAYISMAEVPQYEQALHSARHVVGMKVDDDTTAITSAHDKTQPKIYYNVYGQRVESPSKGVYIVNGKKMIVK